MESRLGAFLIKVFAALDLKFQNWTVVPWKLVGLSHPSVEIAQEVARSCLDMWSRLSDEQIGAQHRISKQFLQPGEIRAELERFARGDCSLRELPALHLEAAKMRLIPMVERSIEAKHGLIHIKALYRKVKPAYVSLQLRMPMWERGVKRCPDHLQETLQNLATTRKARRLANSVGVDRHPDVRIVLDDPLAKKSDLYQVVAAAMYGDDPDSKYHKYNHAQKSNKKQKAKLAKLKVHTGGIPRSRASYAIVVEKTQLEHVRKVSAPGLVYSMPRAALTSDVGAQLVTLQEKLGQGPVQACGESGDEYACETDRVVFSVVSGSPSLARVIPVPPYLAHSLGPDDMAVVLHEDFVGGYGAGHGRVGVGARQVADNPVLILSRLGRQLVEDHSCLQAWRVSQKVKYQIEGIECSSAVVELITSLVSCRALAGAAQSFACEAASAGPL